MLLVDTNVLFAAADRSTAEYSRCAALLDERTEIAITAPVATECAWMMESRLGPRAEAEMALIDLTHEDWSRCAALVDEYQDMGLGLVDASVVAVAERLAMTTIATLNHRDFAVVRPTHCDAFKLIP